jgi:hypothetical protein
MEKLPAKTGWEWVKAGFALFRKQPAELSTLFMSYMFLMFAIGIIPLLGQVLPLVLVPVFSMAFMQACVHVEQGERVYPNLLLTGFRSPAFRSLLALGVLYLMAAIGAVAVSALVDGGVFWNIMSGQTAVDASTMHDSNISLAMLVAAAAYVPAAMAFWYAAPLIMWDGMGVGKAVFYSFFAVRNAGKAFIVYGLAWFLVGALLPAMASSLIALLLGNARITVLILLPVSLIMTVVMYCSFYPTYIAVFRRKEPPPSGDASAT